MQETTRQWILGMLTGLVIATLIAIGISKIKSRLPVDNSEIIPKTIIDAYNTGLKDALRTNPPSWQLEQTCLNMWADKQPVR
jgi:hypothetical protein